MAEVAPRVSYRTEELRLAGDCGYVLVGVLSAFTLLSIRVGYWYWMVPVPLVSGGLIWLIRRLFLYPSVDVVEGGLLVRNPLSSSFVAWGQVSSIEDKRLLEITRVDGTKVRAWGVQQRNLDAMRGSPPTSASGMIVSALRDRVAKAGSDLPSASSAAINTRRREAFAFAGWFAALTVIRVVALLVSR